MKRTLLSLCLSLSLVAGPALANGDGGLPGQPLVPQKPAIQDQETEDQETEDQETEDQEDPKTEDPETEGAQTETETDHPHASDACTAGCPSFSEALPPIEGKWRVKGFMRDPVEAMGGTLQVYLDGSQLRYERRCRTGTSGVAALERGQVLRKGGTLFFKADAQPGGTGLEQILRGQEGEGAADPALGAYRPSEAPNWHGLRRAEDGRRSREHLTPITTPGNDLELLIDGQAFDRMEEAIRGAKRSIDIQTFQWADDETGRKIAGMLAEKVKEGVRVRCLVDASSKTVNWMVSFHTPEPKVDITGQKYHGWRPFPTSWFKKGLDDQMEADGIELIHAHGYLKGLGNSTVGIFRGMWNGLGRLFGKKPKPREKRGISNHDHRKIMVVDEEVAFCGGMNIAREYRYEWHDVVARVEGPAAYEFHESFVDRWQAAGGDDALAPNPSERWQAPDWCGDVEVEVIGSIPGLGTPLKDRYLEEINNAERRILIEMAYFLDDDIIEALGKAAQRGVRTVVIIPDDRVNDVYLVKEAFAWMHNDVLKSGIELYFYQPRLNHSKLAVFDGRRSTIGSCNLDRMALELLAEINIWVDDARFAREIEQRIFVEDLPLCKRAKPIQRGWGGKLRAKFFHMFRGML